MSATALQLKASRGCWRSPEPDLSCNDVSEHNRRKTPGSAESIARHSLPKSEATTRNES
jgi:hypothetical protein